MACAHINQTTCNFVPPVDNFTNIDPCVIEDIECHRLVHDYKRKCKQYLESTGIVTISEPNGLVIEKVFVSARTVMKDITSTFKLLMKQSDSVIYTDGDHDNISVSGEGCPLLEVVFNTGELNKYTGGDIECGVRKLIEVTYITDDKRYAQKKVRRVEVDDSSYTRAYDPTACVDGQRPPMECYDKINVSEVYLINQGKCCGTDEPTKTYNQLDSKVTATGAHGCVTARVAANKTDCEGNIVPAHSATNGSNNCNQCH